MSRLVAAAKAGRSQVLVLRGEAGIGKTALLDVLLQRAAGCRLARAAGVESEMELPFAGLHQLCGPYLDRLGRLPAPQYEALGTTFGLRSGTTPDRFTLGLAVLTLLRDVAVERPLVCVVDDAQWLDRSTAQALEFVARRLAAEPVAMVFALRDGDDGPGLTGLPELRLRGLSSRDAAALLDSAVTGTLDPRVRDRILAESRGNPLALLELPRRLTAADLAFGGVSEVADARTLVPDLQQEFLRELQPLPRQSRRLLLTAAAEPVGDVPLLSRAAERLGIGTDAATAAEGAGLMELGRRVRFRHPLARSAVYRAASPAERREVHRALAEVTDPDADPDRRAWHRAHAAVGPDETVAAELEGSAGHALSHGGLAAAAAFLETASALTSDPARRAPRALHAAQAKATAGSFGDASALLAVAQAGPLDEAGQARIDLLRGRICFDANHSDEALPLLLAAARRLQPVDRGLARETYLDAFSASLFTGRLTAGASARQVAAAARRAPALSPPTRADSLLDGLAVRYTDGYEASAPLLRRAVQAFGTEVLTLDEAVRSAWLAAVVAADLWDDVHWDVLTHRQLDVVRTAGALSALPLALVSRAVFEVHSGDLAAAASLVEESRWVTELTDGEDTLTPLAQVWLAAMRGHEQDAESLIQSTLGDLTDRGQGVGLALTHCARAVLCNGLCRYGDALDAAREAAADPLELGPTKWALAELVEAGVHSGNTSAAAGAQERLAAMTRASGTELALGIEASRGALLRHGNSAEALYREAIDRLAHTVVRVELARAQLRYGEWLRREGRRVDARAQLRTACETLTAMGVEAFAARARAELMATGETVRKRTVATQDELTAQETHIARLAAGGLTNPEIAVAMYLSPRTVEWHLRKVFSKVGISTRRQLRRSMLDADGKQGQGHSLARSAAPGDDSGGNRQNDRRRHDGST